jgi:hypothetical protein
VKLKGRPGGQNISVSPTQVSEIDDIGDDIRKMAMPIPFAGPSPVLLQLLGFLTDAAKGVVSTSEEKIADASNNMPVGTAIALIEQGAKIYSSIHARLHESQRRVLEIIHRLNGEYLDDKVIYGEDENDYVEPKDFKGPIDIYPVSDPNIFSETQRMAQVQALLQLAGTAPPGMYDVRKIHERLLEVLKIPNAKEVMPDPPASKPMNPAAENVALALGTPVAVFPDQDHMSHVGVHVKFATNPILGMSRILAPVLIPAMIEHLKQHVLYQLLGMPIVDRTRKDKSWEADHEVSEVLAKASDVVNGAVAQSFKDLPAMVEKAIQYLQSVMPKPPVDPAVEIAMKDMEIRAKKNEQDAETAAKRLEANTDKQQGDAMLKIKGLQQQIQKLEMQLSAQAGRTEASLQNELQVQEMKSASDIEAERIKSETVLQAEAMKAETEFKKETLRIGADVGKSIFENITTPEGVV